MPLYFIFMKVKQMENETSITIEEDVSKDGNFEEQKKRIIDIIKSKDKDIFVLICWADLLRKRSSNMVTMAMHTTILSKLNIPETEAVIERLKEAEVKMKAALSEPFDKEE